MTETESDILYRVTATHDETLRTPEEKGKSYNIKASGKLPTGQYNFSDWIMTSSQFMQTNSAYTYQEDVNKTFLAEVPTGRTLFYINDDNTLGIVVYGDPKNLVPAEQAGQIKASSIATTEESEFTISGAMNASGTADEPALLTITVSGYVRSEVLRITGITSGTQAKAKLEDDTSRQIDTLDGKTITLWSMGAWGNVQGYPRACTMYQDRLILAGSNLQPQTVWMSRTGDYADFGISDPLRDDDAVNITLAGSRADGIHSLLAGGDLLVFTNGGEWIVKGAGDAGAITPTALAARQQTNIGTKDIQPLIAGGNMILVQSQGRKVYALGYNLNTDGYTGNDISIMSSHIFEGKKIVDMAYQQEPDSLLWFVLDDGTCAVCTYNPEHEVIGWSRQTFSKEIAGIAGMSGDTKTEIFCWSKDYALTYMKDRTTEAGYTDSTGNYESRIRTLRLAGGGDDGRVFTSEKLIARLIVSVLRSSGAWAAPGDCSDAHSWDRRRRIEMDYTEYLRDEEIQLDNGFSTDACIQIRSMDDKPLTVAGITPVVTIGG